MLSRKLLVAVAVSSSILSLVGCANTDKSGSKMAKYGSTGAEVAVVEDAEQFYGTAMDAATEQQLLGQNTIHFGYDRYDLSEASKQVVLAHAKRLLEQPTLKLRVEGHTDERGSREYNIGLGERRAQAVANVLALKGIAPDRVATVSYGKEKPVVLGNSEDSWSVNRRAEMAFEGDN